MQVMAADRCFIPPRTGGLFGCWIGRKRNRTLRSIVHYWMSLAGILVSDIGKRLNDWIFPVQRKDYLDVFKANFSKANQGFKGNFMGPILFYCGFKTSTPLTKTEIRDKHSSTRSTQTFQVKTFYTSELR